MNLKWTLERQSVYLPIEHDMSLPEDCIDHKLVPDLVIPRDPDRDHVDIKNIEEILSRVLKFSFL